MVGNKEREEGVSFSKVELNFQIIEKDFIDMISKSFKPSNPQLSSSASFLRLNVLSSLN